MQGTGIAETYRLLIVVLIHKQISSHDYDTEESPLWKLHERLIRQQNKKQWMSSGKRRAAKRWVSRDCSEAYPAIHVITLSLVAP